MDPAATVQSLSGANRRRRAAVAETESGSKSNEYTWAPIRWAANENRPLPQPMSTKDLPVSRSTPSACCSDRTATSMRPSSTRAMKDDQFAPNANRSPARISVRLSTMGVLLRPAVRAGIGDHRRGPGGQQAPQTHPEPDPDGLIGQCVDEQQGDRAGGHHRSDAHQFGADRPGEPGGQQPDE